jgi:hypothetical protein
MTNIIGVSGKKQSGKNCVANHIVAIELTSLGIVRGQASVNNSGELCISDIFGDTKFEGVLDITRNNDSMIRFRAENLDPYVKIYSFADMLKKNVCMDILGLTWEQCYGTDEQKMGLTHLKWENMPGVVDTGFCDQWGCTAVDFGLCSHEPGPMTGRDVMQYVGTEVFRNMYSDVWANATIRTIEKENTGIAILCDCRFPNEADAILHAGGKVMRLTRDVYEGQDQHDSETALDKGNYDWDKFTVVVDNSKTDVVEQCELVHPILEGWGVKYND